MKKKLIIKMAFCIIILALFGVASTKVLLKIRNMWRYNLDHVSDSIHNQTLDLTRKLNLAYDFDYRWVNENRLIAHAMGGVDEIEYTNSLEAFKYNYENGYRVFEVDLAMTKSENALICVHDFNGLNENSCNSLREFSSAKIYDQYHTINGFELIDLMIEYPDIHIITDTKYTDRENANYQFAALVKYAKDKNAESVLDRIIPQVYNEDMFWSIMNLYEWNSVILTLYQLDWTPEMVNGICERTGIRYITFWNNMATIELVSMWKQQGYYLAVHTENDIDEAKRFIDMGIDNIYTDFLRCDDFE